MTLSDKHYALIKSLDNRTCLCSFVNTHRHPYAPMFYSDTFRSYWILNALEFNPPARIVDVEILETDSQIIITTCNAGSIIVTYIFTR